MSVQWEPSADGQVNGRTGRRDGVNSLFFKGGAGRRDGDNSLLLTDGRVNVMEIIVAFRSFVNTPINWYLLGKCMIIVS